MADPLDPRGSPQGLFDGPWKPGDPLLDQSLSFTTDPPAVPGITGTGASAFGWTDAIAAQEDFAATAASAFGWTDAVAGREVFTSTVAFAFGWSDAIAGREVFTSTAASAFGWADAAAGREDFVIVSGGSIFGWNDAEAGREDFAATVASTFGWTDAIAGRETFTGALASSFGWTDAAAGREVFTSTAASAFGWGDAGVASTPATVSGTGASAFSWSVSATGLVTGGQVVPIGGGERMPLFRTDLRYRARVRSGFGWSTTGAAMTIPTARLHGGSAFRFATAGVAIRGVPIDEAEALLGLDEDGLIGI